MQLERLTAGEYAVTDGEKLISLKKGLNRKWKVEPIAGVNAPARTVRSYGDAKMTAQAMINGEATVTHPTAKADKVSRKAAVALAKAEPGYTRGDLAAALHRVAEEIVASR